MKTMSLASFMIAALAIAPVLAAQAGAQTTQDPAIPVGSLTAFPTVVQTGTHPTLTWNINYPSQVKDIVTITPPGTLTPKQNVYVDVRVLGASVATATAYYPVEAQVKYTSTGSYSRIFYDKQTKVNPATVLYTRLAEKGKTLNFAGRYYYNNAWSSTYNTQSNANQVVALVNGEFPPSTFPDYQQPTIESFLRPYLDSQGRVKIGPMDVIYLFELTHTNTSESGYDLQDLVLLVTFRKP